MLSFTIEMDCPEHGFERFRIKVVKKFNIESRAIKLIYRSRPKTGGISRVYVGRDVEEEEVKEFLIEHLRERGVWNTVLTMKGETY